MCSTFSQSVGMLLNSSRGNTGGKSRFLCDQCMTYAVPTLILHHRSPPSVLSSQNPPLNETWGNPHTLYFHVLYCFELFVERRQIFT